MSLPTVGRLSLAVLLFGGGCEFDAEWDTGVDEVGRSEHAVLNLNQPGWVTTSNGHALANRCAVDPVADIQSGLIADPNYIMAYRSGKHSSPATCSGTTACSGSVPAHYYPEATETTSYHRQSIQRIRRNTKNYLLVTQSVEPAADTCWYPGFEVIEMGSAEHGTGTLNLGSGGVTPTSPALCNDHVVKYQEYSSTVRRHAGGMQVSGSYVSVAFEDPNHTVAGSFRTFDVSDPPNSFSGPTVLRQDGDVTQASSAALTRINDQRFMVMVFGQDAADVEVFISAGTTMPTTPTDWDSKVAVDFDGTSLIDYANMQFVTKCDSDASGLLYLVATYKNAFGEDWVYLYQVTFESSTTYVPTFDVVTSRKMTCSSANTGGTRYCDFDAGAGVFVDGNGRLMLYGVEHWNDHNDGYSLDHAVKVREFSTH